jgi:hypothetical protein
MPLPDKWDTLSKRCKAWVLLHVKDLLQDPQFPLEALALPKISLEGSHAEIQMCCAQWLESTQSFGALVFEERPTRRFGILRIPIALQPKDRKALYSCACLGEFMKTLTQMSKDCGEDQVARELLFANPTTWISQATHWKDLLRLAHWSLANADLRLYPREIMAQPHGKFYEEHCSIIEKIAEALAPGHNVFTPRQKPYLVRMRFLDSGMNRAGIPLMDFSATIEELANIALAPRRIVVLENEWTYLAFGNIPNTIAIFGKGFAVRVLALIPWIQNAEIWYWGDLDAQGFQILNTLRSGLGHVKSFGMDFATLEHHRKLWSEAPHCPAQDLRHLTPEEMSVFEALRSQRIRLEQERILPLCTIPETSWN